MIINYSQEGISVIVCCYNSGSRLPETLKHLAYQNMYENISWEIIVVNNASTDNTAFIAKKEWDKYELPNVRFKVVEQNIPGLNNAREKGVEEASYEYLIFCDDDNWLDDRYIQHTFSCFSADKKLGIIGGIGSPIFEKEKPWWFDDFYHGFAVGKQYSTEGYVDCVYGAGMALRKSFLTNKNLTFIPMLLTDRKGTNLSAGGDSEICFRANLLNYKVLYTEKLKFKHFLSQNRLNWKYLIKLHKGFAQSFLPLEIYRFVLENKPVSSFYWVEQAIRYYSRVIKYSIIYFPHLYRGSEGKAQIINLNTWLIMGNGFMKYNVKITKIHSLLKRLKAIKN